MATREFEFKDGKSDKFWKITLDGKSHTVHFGRRDTAGQEQTKEFGSEAEARKSHDKLVAEKVGKGYVETTSGATAPLAAVASKPKPAAPKSAASPPSPLPPALTPSMAAPVAADRRIDLHPLDWGVATWRKQSLDLPSPQPFDLETCLLSLRRLKTSRYGWVIDWQSVELPAAMSKEEAQFWYTAASLHERDTTAAQLVERLKSWTYKDAATSAEVGALLRTQAGKFLGNEFLIPLRTLIGPEGLADIILGGGLQGAQAYEYNADFLRGFRRYVIPHLSTPQMDALRTRVRPDVTPQKWPQDYYRTTDRFQLAAALGMHAELRAVVESIPESFYGKQDWDDHYHQPQVVVFGLGSSELVDRHFRRLRLRIKIVEHLSGWLAHTQWNGLDLAKDSLIALTNREECEKLVAHLQIVHAPEAAGPLLELKLRSKAPKQAGEWFAQNPEHAAVGLVPVAAGRGPLSESAVEMLRDAKKKGMTPLIEKAAAALSSDASARIRAEVLEYKEVELQDLTDPPSWLTKGLEAARAGAKRFKPPAWAEPASLPPLILGGKRLSNAQVVDVLTAIQSTTLDATHPFLEQLRDALQVGSRDAFAWKLFERWLAEGAPSKDKWAMASIGRLGGDESVLKLAPLIRAWPGEAQHQRAVLGLEILRCVGSDAALMQLNGIAQKLKFQGLKTKAREFMEAIAEAKGLSRSELEDRIVPDCELDERGRRVFEAGGKTYEFVLGPEMKPMVKDPEGKLRPDLPDSAGEAVSAEWKLMKKQIKEVAAIQVVRLEQAMVTGRRWKSADFGTLILKHPLMTHLARLLVWGVHDDQGKLGATFRVTAEQDLANIKDESFKLPNGSQVGLIHALHLDEESKRAWGQVFADYELMPPFPQIGRGVNRLQGGEEKSKELARFMDVKVSAPSLVHTLEKLGWQRGLAMDGGCFDEHSRQFPGAGLTAFVTYEGTVGMGYIDANEMLTMKGAYFLPGLRKPSGYEKYIELSLPLKDVDPVVLSETIHDLEIVAAKGDGAKS